MSIDSSNGDEFPASPATLLSHEEVRPQVVGQRRTSLSRVAAYRRKLRRQRNRRLSLIVAVTIACVASGLSYIANHPEFKIQNYIPKETLDVGPVDDYLEQVALKMKESLAKLSQLSKAKKSSDPSTEEVVSDERENEAEEVEEKIGDSS